MVSAVISANPPSTAYSRTPPSISARRMPGRRVVMTGAWPGMAVSAPPAPGICTEVALPETMRASGETRSNCMVSAISAPYAAAAAIFSGLGDHVFDAPDHVEGRFGQVVVFSRDDGLERPDRVLERHLHAGRAGEDFRHVEGLRQEALELPRPGHRQLVLFGEFVHAEDRDDVLQRLVALEDGPARHGRPGSAPRRPPPGRECATSNRAGRRLGRCRARKSRAIARSSRRGGRRTSRVPGR